MLIDGDFAYLAANSSPLGIFFIVDISHPSSPVPVGTSMLSDEAHGLVQAGNIVYVATYEDGITVIDISDKTSPAIRSMSLAIMDTI